MTLQIPHDKHTLQIFFNSQDVENFLKKNSYVNIIENKTEFIYFARYGKSFDGHKFALEIIRSKNFIAGEKEHIVKFFSNIIDQEEILQSNFFISVENVNESLIHAVKNFTLIHDLDFKSIGVTGTSGKTSVVQLTGQILESLPALPKHEFESSQKILKIGTLGIEIGERKLSHSHLTTPDYPAFITALAEAKNENIKTLIMEVSSHGLAERRLNDFLFDIAVFTNFSQDHLDFHNTMEEYLTAKTLLFSKHLKKNSTCILSTQSTEWLHIVQNSVGAERILYLILNDNENDVFKKIEPYNKDFKAIYFLKIENKSSTLNGLCGNFHLKDMNKKTLVLENFSTPLIGEINFENVMHAFSICHTLGYNPQEFVGLFSHLKGIAGRMEKVKDTQHTPKNSPYVIVDYSHKPGALESVIRTLRHLIPPNKKLITVFGCGGNRDSTKRPLMGRVATELSNITIITSDNPRYEDPNKIIDDIIAGVSKTSSYFVEVDRRRAIQMAFEFAEESDIILLAGRGHETHQLIENHKIEFSDVEVAREFLK